MHKLDHAHARVAGLCFKIQFHEVALNSWQPIINELLSENEEIRLIH